MKSFVLSTITSLMVCIVSLIVVAKPPVDIVRRSKK